MCDGEHTTYAELNERANRVAHYLRANGVGANTLVALYLERTRDMTVAILGVIKAGAGYLPLEPIYPADRLAFMLGDAQPAVVLTQQSLRDGLPETSARVVSLDSDWPEFAAQPDANLAIAVPPDSLAYVIYTSGSTGRPKGVVITHRNVTRLIDQTDDWFHFDERDVWTVFHSFSFDFSVWEYWGPLLTGGRLVVVPYWLSRSPEAFHALLVSERVTVLNQTPSAFRQLMQVDAAAGAVPLALRYVIFGGEALDLPSLAPWFARHGDSAPQLINMYGITETTVHVTYRRITAEDAATAPGSLIGEPIPDLQVHVVDARGELVPIGVPGEMLVGGEGLARGYLGRPELTAERFVPNPFGTEPGTRLYRSGDLARRLASGDMQYLGRIDDQVKIRGYRIELGEIQQVLEQHPGVEHALVVAREFGAGDTRLVAYLTPDRKQAATVREFLALEREGAIPASSRYELPNGMAIVHLNQNETDFLYREVFEDLSYLRHGITIEAGDCVFDVGANIGLFSLFAARQAEGVRVFAFEPIPPVFELMRANTRLHHLDATLFQAGAAGEAGSATFHYYPRVSIISGRFADAETERAVVTKFVQNQTAAGDGVDQELFDDLLSERLQSTAVECRLVTLSDVIREHQLERIDLLKVDVEKSESEVLRGIRDEDWPRIRQAIIEVHDSDGQLAQITELLSRHGFSVTVDQDTLLEGTPALQRLCAPGRGAGGLAGGGRAGSGRGPAVEQSGAADCRREGGGQGTAAGVHGAVGVCPARGVSVDGQRQGGSPRAARAGLATARGRSGVCRATDIGRAHAGRDLGARAAGRAGGHPRQLLRAGRRFDPGHPGDLRRPTPRAWAWRPGRCSRNPPSPVLPPWRGSSTPTARSRRRWPARCRSRRSSDGSSRKALPIPRTSTSRFCSSRRARSTRRR